MFQTLLKYIVPQKSKIREITEKVNRDIRLQKELELEERFPIYDVDIACEVVYKFCVRHASLGYTCMSEMIADRSLRCYLSSNRDLIEYRKPYFIKTMKKKYGIRVEDDYDSSTGYDYYKFYW
jgi:hypothetical protein